MKLIQANPKTDNEQTIYSALNAKERLLRHGVTSFSKASKNKWKHVKFQGRVTAHNTPENILFAKIQAKSPDDEAKLFQAFVGYLSRHCGDLIYSMTIYYQ